MTVLGFIGTVAVMTVGEFVGEKYMKMLISSTASIVEHAKDERARKKALAEKRTKEFEELAKS